jgi:mono/diheme cytochrome c family protein
VTGRIVTRVFRGVLAAIVVAVALLGCAHEHAGDPTAHYSGQRLYETYCSGCHGLDGEGNGPVEPFTAAHAPRLTRIAARNGGSFPAEKVFRMIDGQFETPPPNTRHMPIWGYELFTGEGDDEAAHQKVTDMEHRIVKYLESIQVTEQ